MTKIIYQIPYYQNIGIAKHTKYDTLITGTSMTQNFRANKFDEKFNCKAIRLSFDGGILPDFCTLLDTAVSNNKQLKTIFFGLDNYLITEDSSLIEETKRIPQYLTDNNPVNDVNYLLNKDVIFKYIRTYFAYKFSDSYEFYEMHAWDKAENYIFSKEVVLEGYSIPKELSPISESSYHASAQETVNQISTFVKNNPKINFVFFAPPYSILYWHKLVTEGKLDATLSAMKKVYGELLMYDNVKFYYFQNIYDMIINLNNYRDYTHYHTKYNEYMLDCFISGKHEITKENYNDVLDSMKQLAMSYDYDALLKS